MFLNRSTMKNSVFIHFLFSYIAVLILPVLIGSIVYHKSVDIVEEYVKESNLLMLEQTKEILDRRLSEIESVATQIAFNSKIRYLLNVDGPIEGPNMYKLREASNNISSYELTNSFISDVHIYFKNSNVIVTPKTCYVRLPLIYGKILKYDYMDYHTWQDNMFNKVYNKAYLPAKPAILNGEKNTVITYAQSIPFEFPNQSLANIFVYIKEEEIKKLLEPLILHNNGLAYISDKYGRIIFQISQDKDEFIASNYINLTEAKGYLEQNLLGTKMFITYTRSAYNDWRFVVAVPSYIIKDRVKYIKNLILAVILTVFIIGISAAFFLANRNYKPIRNIVSSLIQDTDNKHNEISNVFQYIQDSIAGLVYRNKMLRDMMYEQKPMLKQAFFDRLLRGEFENVQQLDKVLQQINIRIAGEAYIVILASIGENQVSISEENIKELQVIRPIVKGILSRFLAGNGYFHNVDINRIAVIMTFTKENVEDYKYVVEKVVGEVSKEAADKFAIRIVWSGGCLCDNLIDVYLSFNEARRVLDQNNVIKDDVPIIWNDYSRNQNFITGYYYPIDLEIRILNSMRSGDYNQIKKLLKKVYIENFFRRDLSYNKRQQLINEMYSTLVKGIGQIEINDTKMLESIEDKIETLHNYNTIDEIYNNFVNMYSYLCDIVNQLKNSHNTKLINGMISYINENFTNSNLSLKLIAEKYGITDVYMSQFFKEQTGENFSNYLEKIRLQFANELLATSNLSIDKIATKVGYNSSNTFRRAYKRLHGISPTEFRKKIRLGLSQSDS